MQHQVSIDSMHNSPNNNSSLINQMNSLFFHFGAKESFLFNFWNISSEIGIIFACFLILILCFLLEFIGWYQNVRRQKRQFGGGQNKITTINATGNRIGNESKINKITKIRLTKETIVDALIHGIHLTLGNLLMVIFMSLNIWLCGAVIFGQIIARFIFSIFSPKEDDAS